MKNTKYDLYLNAFIDSIENYAYCLEEKIDTNLHLKRSVFYGVKMINKKELPRELTIQLASENFQLCDIVKSLIGLITPTEFENIFPITKTYDGKKWQSKDYYYTKEYLDKLDHNKPIGVDEVTNLLWEYQNIDIKLFAVGMMGYMSDLRQLGGYPSLFEEWADMTGIQESPSIHKDSKGRRFIIHEGKIQRLEDSQIIDPRPKYLRLVE